MIPLDKITHGLVGYSIMVTCGANHILLGYSLVIIAGIGKEIYDKMNPKKHTSDPWDFFATLVGGIIGSISLQTIRLI